MATRYCFRCGRETVWKEDATCSECRHGRYLSARQPDGEPFVTKVPREYDWRDTKQTYGGSGCLRTPARRRKWR